MMFYVLTWSFVFALLALWSLAAWALHGAAVWAVSNAGALSGAGASAVGLPQGLAPWLPPEIAQALSALIATIGPMIDSVLQAAPALAGGMTVLSWVVWGLGSALLLLLGAGLHLLVVLWRRRSGSGGSPSGTGPSLVAG